MESLFASFLVVLLAEMGDKTQFLVMAFAAKYDWKRVFIGMSLGILVVHALAVAAGALVGELIPSDWMGIIASLIFLGFGIWTLRGEDEAEEAHDSSFGPVMTVATTFILGEMGDKTQFAAMTMAAQYDGAWLAVLAGAVLGMIVADSLGIVAGALLHCRLPAQKMRFLSAGIFILFGVTGLLRAFIW